MSAPFLYPSPSDAALKLHYVGKRLPDVATPAAILDLAVIKRNCKLMLDTVQKLGVEFRAHVKTHKTTELSVLQIGEDTQSVRLLGSTVSELEGLLPWLLECKAKGKTISAMYGIPLGRSTIPRLATLARALGTGSIGCFIDHPDQVKGLDEVNDATWPGQIPVFVNIDIGYHREGVAAESTQLMDIAQTIANAKRVKLYGLYSHFGNSYNVSSPEEALADMAKELEGVEKGAVAFLKSFHQNSQSASQDKIVLSIGASPTATAAQNLFEDIPGVQRYRDMIARIQTSFEVEIHAGVYPVMDMQQLATHARPAVSSSDPQTSLLGFSDIGLRMLVEVTSLYPDRGSQPEAMIAAGSIVLGREPCKSYSGWGVVSHWPASSGPVYDPDGSRTGWIIGRISQEHGVLTWEGPTEQMRPLHYGEKVLIWPNHACIAGASAGWYLIVDSSSSDADRIVDVWTRWRGW